MELQLIGKVIKVCFKGRRNLPIVSTDLILEGSLFQRVGESPSPNIGIDFIDKKSKS